MEEEKDRLVAIISDILLEMNKLIAAFNASISTLSILKPLKVLLNTLLHST